MAQKYFGGTIPAEREEDELDQELIQMATELCANAMHMYPATNFQMRLLKFEVNCTYQQIH